MPKRKSSLHSVPSLKRVPTLDVNEVVGPPTGKLSRSTTRSVSLKSTSGPPSRAATITQSRKGSLPAKKGSLSSKPPLAKADTDATIIYAVIPKKKKSLSRADSNTIIYNAAPVAKKKKPLAKKTSSKKVKKPVSKHIKKTSRQGKKTTQLIITTGKELFYVRGEFVALKADDDDFYLAQICQHVYHDTGRFRVRWLEKADFPGAEEWDYSITYTDVTVLECIITHVKLKKLRKPQRKDLPAGEHYRLPISQRNKILKEIKKLQHEHENGDDDSEEENEEEADADDDAEEPPSKTRKVSKKKSPQKSEKSASKKKKEKPDKTKRRALTEEEKANPNLLLVPNKKVKVLEKDPLLETRDNFPFVSTDAHCKLVHRAVNLGDMKLLKKLVSDYENICSVTAKYSFVSDEPVTHAIEKDNQEAIKTLLTEMWKKTKPGKSKQRVEPTKCLLSETATGSYNYRSLGIPHIRKLTMSRGAKEGNNALLKSVDVENTLSVREVVTTALRHGVRKETLDLIINLSSDDKNKRHSEKQLVFNMIDYAVKNGHRILAGKLVEEAMKDGISGGFNQLHRDVLLFNNEELKPFRDVSCKKKPWNSYGITPIHCAAINPNAKYITKLLSVLPEYNILDKGRGRPVHYAAACEGTGPLDFLLKKGVDPSEVDGNGMTPLMIACKNGRAHNVKLLLDKAKQDNEKCAQNDADAEDEGDDSSKATISKYGIGGINQPNQKMGSDLGCCPIHLAVMGKHIDVVKELLKHEVNIHAALPPSGVKATALMLACGIGHLALVKLLIQHGARVEEKDRLKRTPLIHACMNGQAAVASYLLNLGANPNAADSSGNSCMHYAAAYGWYHCVKVLIEAGADAARPNDWKMTPMWIAFLKGHVGLVDILLQQPNVDINFRDEDGMTLLAMACTSPLVEGLEDQIKYLTEKRKADVKICDAEGSNCLHHLASNNVKIGDDKMTEAAIKISEKLAKYLMKHGCGVSVANKSGCTPLTIAIKMGNIALVKALMEECTGTLPAIQDQDGRNLLHHMALQCISENQCAVLDTLLDNGENCRGQLRKMATAVDNEGYTPLLLACRIYHFITREKLTSLGKNGSQGDVHNDDDCDDDEDGDDDVDEDEGSDDQSDRPAKKKSKVMLTKVENQENDKLAWSEEQQRMKEARNFIDKLLSECGSKVTETVQKKKVEDEDTSKWSDLDFYTHANEAGWQPVFYMLGAQGEIPTERKDGRIVDPCPGLAMLLDHSPELNFHDLNGFTPLLFAIYQYSKLQENQSDMCSDAYKIAHCVVKKMVEHGADMDLEFLDKTASEPLDKENLAYQARCPVNLATRLGFVETVQFLAGQGADLTKLTVPRKQSVLHLSFLCADDKVNVFGMVKSLVEKGAAVNHQDWLQRTPLHVALETKPAGTDATADTEAFLIENGADLKAKDCNGRIPLHLVFCSTGKARSTDQHDPIDLCTTFTSCMTPEQVNTKDTYGSTALHYAAIRGAGVCCMNLIKRGADINMKDGDGNTPLALAAVTEHESCVILLLQQGADITQPVKAVSQEKLLAREKREKELEKSGLAESLETPPMPLQWKPIRDLEASKMTEPEISIFQASVLHDWQGVAFLLFDQLEKFNINTTSTVKDALQAKRFNLALTLLRKIKDRRQIQGTLENGQTLFHLLADHANPAAQTDIQLRVAEKLLDAGVSITKEDEFGCSPLHCACFYRQAALTNFFLDSETQADVNQVDKNGRTPLAALIYGECAMGGSEGISSRFKEIFARLVKSRAKLNLSFKYILPAVDCFDYKPKLVHLNKQYTTETGHTVSLYPLQLAILLQHFDMVKFLLENQADVNCADSNGKTAMMYAVATNNADLVRLLLDHSYIRKDPENKDDDSCPDENSDDDSPSENDDSGSDYDPNDSDSGTPRKRKAAKKRPRPKKKLSRRLFAHRTIGEDAEADADVSSAKKYRRKATQVKSELEFWKNFKVTKKNSKVDLNAVDKNGQTALHYLAASLKFGSYDNTAILKLLADNGAYTHCKDRFKMTALDHCIVNGLPNLSKGFQKLMGVRSSDWREPVVQDVEVQDGLGWMTPAPDFRADALAMLRKVDAQKSSSKTEEDNKLKPDKVLKIANGEVYIDDDLKVPYDVLLTKIDVTKGAWCLYNFYKLQLVYDKKKKLYVLLNRWGRIGDEGQYQQTPFSTPEEGVKEFVKIFRAKTGNRWNDINSFEPHMKKYRLVAMEDRQQKTSHYNEITFHLKSTKTSLLPKPLQDFVRDISSVKGLKKSLAMSEINQDAMPFGRINIESLKKARELLENLKPVVESMKKRGYNSPGEAAEYYEEAKQIADATNEYYHLVPSGDFTFEKLRPLDNMNTLMPAIKKIENLLELEIAGRILAAAEFRSSEVNPLDYIYRSLNTQLKPMKEDDVMAQYLLKYIHSDCTVNRKPPWLVEQIYEVCRDGEMDRYKKCMLDNQRLLFHGTKSSNLLGILSRGLLITPVEATWTGRAFGNGIYFSDSFQKSYAYSANFNPESNRRHVLVCQVKLGKVYEFYLSHGDEPELTKKHNSLMVKGLVMPDPQYDVTLPNGVVAPLGREWKNTNNKTPWYLKHSEYVALSEEQVCIKYIIQLCPTE